MCCKSLPSFFTSGSYVSIQSATFAPLNKNVFGTRSSCLHILVFPLLQACSLFPLAFHSITSFSQPTQAYSFRSSTYKLVLPFRSNPINTKKCAKPLCILHRSFPFAEASFYTPTIALTRNGVARYIHPHSVNTAFGFIPLATHFIAPFRNPHGFIPFFQHRLKAVFPFSILCKHYKLCRLCKTLILGYKSAVFAEYIPHFYQKVMYYLNPAVIRSILSSMPKDQFILHARYIRRQANKSVPGSNRRAMFVRLYLWCRNHYRQSF